MLYVDEINLLPDAIVDVLLDVAASGINRIERDGISHSHAARFVLIGTMNPEEGMLRPQLLDRLGLCVQLDNANDPQLRSSIVKARLRFDQDPQGFARSHATEQQEIRQRLTLARSRCRNASELAWSDAVHEAVALQCISAQVDGLRADLVMLRAARALAAWQGSQSITPAHVSEVAPLVLQHRASQPDPGSSSQLRQPPQPRLLPSRRQRPPHRQARAAQPAQSPIPRHQHLIHRLPASPAPPAPCLKRQARASNSRLPAGDRLKP